MKSDDLDDLVVAKVRKPHGVAGLIKIHSYSGDFSHIEAAEEVRISIASGIRTFSIEKKVPMGGEILLKLKGIDTPEAVRAIAGGEIILNRRDVPPCKKDEFFIADLHGCKLILNGEEVAVVVSIVTNAANDLLEVEKIGGGTVFIPMLKQFVGNIDIKARQIELLESWFLE